MLGLSHPPSASQEFEIELEGSQSLRILCYEKCYDKTKLNKDNNEIVDKIMGKGQIQVCTGVFEHLLTQRWTLGVPELGGLFWSDAWNGRCLAAWEMGDRDCGLGLKAVRWIGIRGMSDGPRAQWLQENVGQSKRGSCGSDQASGVSVLLQPVGLQGGVWPLPQEGLCVCSPPSLPTNCGCPLCRHLPPLRLHQLLLWQRGFPGQRLICL